MELQAVAEAVDALVACDPRRFSDAESILELQRQLNRLEAFTAEASACFETSGDWAADGAKSAAAWLATRTRLPKRTVRRHLRLGATARRLPATEAAWLSGEIGEAHVAAISSFHHGPLAEVLERDEGLLVDNARRMRFSAFDKTLRYWAQCADPRVAEADFESLKERREVYLSSSFEGRFLGKITLDPSGDRSSTVSSDGWRTSCSKPSGRKRRSASAGTPPWPTSSAAPPNAGRMPSWKWRHGRPRAGPERAGPNHCSPCS
ncbi:MAG TPA: DUF222 domain-containing protein [Acidimicrobiales bacterium]|nr:DUF222 domain-containing protein [Acidimicrobiales bacterium]